MTDTPRVGIVVRTKNRPWFLARTLEDIGAQEFDSWSVQIVDDGGDGAAVDDVVAAAPSHVRARTSVLHNLESTGRSAAANAGVRALSTEYLVLHDDDDLWHPRFLSETVAWLDSHPEDIGVVTRTEIVIEAADGDGFSEVGRETFWSDIDEIRFGDLLEINRWVPIAYLYRRSLHDRVGFYDETIHAAEDWDFGLRTLVRHHVGFVDGPALAYWMHRRDVTGDLGNSMFTLAREHERYDARIRDDALRDYVAQNGAGLVLHLTRLITEQRSLMRELVHEELARELDARPSDLDRLRRKVFRRGRR